MTALNHKPVFAAATVVLICFFLIAAYLSQPLWLLAPVILMGTFFLVQYPVTLFYLLLFSIPWSVEYNFSSTLGTDLPDEPFMLLMAFTAVGLMVIHRKKLAEYKNSHLIFTILLLQIAWVILTVICSSHFFFSFKFLLAKCWYLLAFLAAPIYLWQNEKILERSVLILFLSMLAVSALVMFRHASSEFTFSSINEALRPFFRNHVNYSALLVFMIPLQVVFLQFATTKAQRVLIAFSLAITLPALYLSFARGAWLALFTGLASYWLIKWKWLFKAFILLILLSVSLVLWLRHNDRYLQFAHDYQSTVFHQDFREHLAATYQLKDLSTAERFHRWIAGVRMVEDSWMTGFGPTTFYQHYKSYSVPAFKTWVSKNPEQSTVHKYFLLLVIEQGIVGLLLFLLLLGALFFYAERIYHRTDDRLWKKATAAIAAILVMQCTLNSLSDLIETDKVGSVFYLCIAALIIANKKTRKDLAHHHKP